ncbi:unnamed protein product [Cylindrotheca closterium]|uniref:ABC transporter domain-containing protein n=1 Tax=Cylindrotheca closterium TaxID=2856 RepID=A0AAD2FNR8_9STRA|nr:unnamed protein product [Cylindrotheca closterium]
MASEAEASAPITTAPEEFSSARKVPSEEEKSVAEEAAALAEETAENGDNEAASNGADDADDANDAVEEAAATADTAEEDPPSETTKAVASDVDKPKEESDEGSEDENENEETKSSEEETVQVVAKAVKDEPSSQPSSSAAASDNKDMKETESGFAEEDSPEEPAKASFAGIATEDASSVSSARDVEKDSQTVGSQDSDPASTRRGNRQASSLSQILALIRKNILTKLRTPGATFFELFSPVLMMLVLSAAYTLTEIEYEDAAMYASLNLAFPGPWIDLAQRTQSVFPGSDMADAMGRRRKLKKSTRGEDPNLLVQMMNSDTSDDEKTWDGIFEGLQQKMEQIMLKHTQEIASDEMDQQSHNRRLQTFRNNVDTSLDAEVESYELLDDARDEIRDLLQGPIPTPSFSQFVSISTALFNIVPLDSLPRIFGETSFGRQWGNLLTLGTLHLSPRNQAAEDFWAYLNETYPVIMLATSGTNISNFRVRMHDDEASALNYIEATNGEERTWALLDFANFDREQDSNSYQIRLNYTTVPNVNEITNWANIGLSRRYQRYYLSGYMTLQRTINEFAFAQSGCDQDLSSIMSMPMPTAAYSQNPFFTQVGYLLGLTMAMAFLYPTSRFIKTLVEEKETKMKETLLILGVRTWAHWMSWFLTALLVFIIITVSVAFTLSATVLKHTDPAYLFAFVFLFGTSTIGFCFAIASFFSRAKLAAIIGPIALFATILPRFVFFESNRYENVTGQILSSLFPATAFCFGADIIADYEYAEQGIQSYNAGEGGYSFNTALLMMLADTFLYIFIGWYLDQVLPQQYGVPRPFYFLFLPSYWLGECAKKDGGKAEIFPDIDNESPDVEPVNDTNLIPKVQIRGLVKQYFKGKTAFPPAVDGLNLTMYESQITALLGHNGAGKTTTVSVLTGLFPPTSGDCVLYNKSIVNSKQEARQSLGICPQHNILFDELTVYEHLAFFMRIKGLHPERNKILGHAEEIGLTDYLGTASKALSGGNKRKLSVAIALSGDPDVLILDEPTSAMDPHSRRAVWELLRAKKKGRVTLLTTHFMDEAELLSDRVAVMKEGKLKCCGSPIFLKERFGLGYSMTVVLEPPAVEGDEEGGPARPSENVFLKKRENVLGFLNERIANTTIVRTSGKEVTFRFPQGSEVSFPGAFDDIEINKDDLGIGAYGIQNSSLEEVFLQLAESKSDELEEASSPSETPDEVIYDGEYSHLSPLGQIGLLYGKRLSIQRRDKKGACFTIIVPILVIAVVLVILTVRPPNVYGRLEMNPAMFQTSNGGKRNSATNIVISDRLSSSSALEDASEATDLFMESIKTRYSNAEFTLDTNTDSSMGLSQFLLDNYNNRDHATRFGAFVLNDMVNFTFGLDVSAIQSLIDTAGGLQSLTAGIEQTEIELISLFGLGDENGTLNVAVNLTDLPAMISSFGITLPSVTIDVPELTELVDTSLGSMLSASNMTDLSLGFLEDYLNRTYYFSPDIELQLPGIGNLNQTTSIANSNTTGNENSTKMVEDNMTVDDPLASVFDSKILQIDPFDLVSFIQSSGPYNRSTLIRAIDSLLPFVYESLGVQTNATMIPSGSSFFRLLDNVTAQLTDTDFVDDNLFGNDTFFGDNSFFNDTLLGDIGLFNGTTLGTNITLNGTTIGEIPGTGYFEQLNATDSEQLSNAIAIAATVILRESLSEVAYTNTTFDFSEIFSGLLSSVGYNGTLDSLGLPIDGDDLFDIRLQASSITLELPSFALNIYNLTLIADEDLPVLLPFASFDLLDVALDSLGPMIPEEFVMPIEAQTSILHNSSSPHAVAAFNQAYMEYKYGQCKASDTVTLKSINAPLPITAQETIEIKTILSVVAALFLLIPYCYIPGAFSVFIVKEKISKSKHLQLVSGVNMTSYWFSTYLWDMSLFFLLTVFIMLVFLAYGTESAAVFIGDIEAFFATALITLGYGFSILPFSYLLARNFDNPSTAQISVIGLVFLTGFVAVNAYFLMTALEDTQALAASLLPLFRLWPAFNVGEGFIELSSAYWEREVLASEKRPFDWEVAGRSITLLYGLAPAYFMILLFLEYADDGGSGGMAGRIVRYVRGSYERTVLAVHGVKKVGNKLTLDDGLVDLAPNDDVKKEADFVNRKPELHKSAPIVLRDLWKVFPPSIGLLGGLINRIKWLLCCCGLGKGSNQEDESNSDHSGPRRAVRGLTAAVQRGETFGLLGANGAGKTTTLGMLTGDIAATGGEAYVAGHDITGATPGGVQEARKNIGFCPQIDPLLGLMTGRETLRMFARLRGIQANRIEEVVTALLEKLTLTPHADKTADSYSGGNKRKLSLGIAALVADGGVLLIDECSSGLDPLARKKLWGLIEKLALERSVVITTHSMEEAEALCSRIGIMARGQFVALGTVQHLKTKHLDGYAIDISLAPNSSEAMIDSVVEEICTRIIPGSVISERHGRFLKFDVNKVSTIGLGTTFGRLQELKESRGIVENYSIAQCSLEQVFIKLVKEAEEARNVTPDIAST